MTPNPLPPGSWASSPAARSTMIANRSRDTGPEFAVRRSVHSMGLRYRVDVAPLPGVRRRADLVFNAARVAVFVDGCWWHGCPAHYRPPATNREYWEPKIERNRTRDADTDTRLRAAGWEPVRVWEHDDPTAAAELIATVVAARSGRQSALRRE